MRLLAFVLVVILPVSACACMGCDGKGNPYPWRQKLMAAHKGTTVTAKPHPKATPTVTK